MKRILILLPFILMFGCMQLHNVQYEDIDTTRNGKKFEIVITETGFSSDEAADVAQGSYKMANMGQESDEIEMIRLFLEMSQFGPKTGDPVFDDRFADNIEKEILKKCPSGNVINLAFIRETKDSPIVSGEMVRIKGECIQ